MVGLIDALDRRPPGVRLLDGAEIYLLAPVGHRSQRPGRIALGGEPGPRRRRAAPARPPGPRPAVRGRPGPGRRPPAGRRPRRLRRRVGRRAGGDGDHVRRRLPGRHRGPPRRPFLGGAVPSPSLPGRPGLRVHGRSPGRGGGADPGFGGNRGGERLVVDGLLDLPLDRVKGAVEGRPAGQTGRGGRLRSPGGLVAG